MIFLKKHTATNVFYYIEHELNNKNSIGKYTTGHPMKGLKHTATNVFIILNIN